MVSSISTTSWANRLVFTVRAVIIEENVHVRFLTNIALLDAMCRWFCVVLCRLIYIWESRLCIAQVTEGKSSLENGLKHARKVRKETDLLKEFISQTERVVIEQTRSDSTLPPEQLVTLLEVKCIIRIESITI